MEFWLPGIAALLILMFFGLPIAFAMGLVGAAGLALKIGLAPALALVGTTAFDTGLSYTLSVVPLFILMGNLVVRAGISDELYAASNAFLGHRPGGLAMATIVACGGFSAVSGSSLATAATMARVAMPSMQRYSYDEGLASGAIAAGGTLGILIPPSIILILYGVQTQQDIGKLFIAGILPGLLGILFYLAAVRFVCALNPAAGPPGERQPWSARWRALAGVWRIAVLFVVVIGGIYLGIFTATEAAGIGAFGAFVFTLAGGRLTLRGLYATLADTIVTTAMMFTILIGALIFSNFVNIAGLPSDLTRFVAWFDLPPIAVLLVVLGLYFVLGMVLESLSMVLLTIPIFVPVAEALGFDLVWFGILMVMMTEISLITPPVGMNVYVLKTVLPKVPVGTMFRGVAPFVAADVVRVAILVAFPSIALFLPSLM